MSDHETNLIGRRRLLRRLLATSSLVSFGAGLSPAWSQSHGSHGAHGGHVTRPRILGASPPRAATTPILTPPQGPALINPPALLADMNGNYALNAAMVDGSVGGTKVYVRAFVDGNPQAQANGPLVAPTISIPNNGQQQKVSVKLTNILPAETAPQNAGPVTQPALNEAPHGFNTINLHTHGLHVDPLEDNVFIELQPQANAESVNCGEPTRANPVVVCNGSFTYNYNFGQTPKGTTISIPAGTYWYHPHKHGSVGVQVASGMSGAFVVRGDLDDLAGVKGLTENTMVLQYIPFTPDPTQQSRSIVDPLNFYGINPNAPLANQLKSINGQINPTIAMQYGQIQRWRFINATSDQFFYLEIKANSGAPEQGPQLFAIAVDGVPLTHSPTGITVPYLLGTPSAIPAGFADTVMNEIAILAPAQRLDLLVQAPASGANATYSVNAMQWPRSSDPSTPPQDQTIATISLAGTKTPADALPASALFSASATPPLVRPPLDQAIPVNSTQNIQFGFTNSGLGVGAMLNLTPSQSPFAASAPPLISPTPFTLPLPPPPPPPPFGQLNLKLNAVDRWQVWSDPAFGFGPHAFHIHINSFMMLQRNGIDISAARIWRDTVRIDQQPASTPSNPNPSLPLVQFVSQQVDYTGDFVMHCHVLQHEDAGMMWSVNIS